ncbi:MAG: hypothetical protein JOZ10_08565 [Acidobacteria bacterium]|nr:hypothetical protein [Acidobacteriota bacterium]
MGRKLQIVLLVFFVLAGIRVFMIYRGRHAAVPAPAATPNPNFSADDYVVPTQTHAYDLKSSKEALDGKTVWVKSGNQVYYYPVSGGHVDFKHATGLLPPLDKLSITNVMQATAPASKGQEIAPGVRVHEEQVLAAFHRADDSKTYAAPIGASRGGDYTLYINDTFYFEDPHQLYKHWPPDIWSAIDQHQAKKGMNELQVAMALGVGVPQGSGGEYGNRTLTFDNNGHPITVTFDHNRAVQVTTS